MQLEEIEILTKEQLRQRANDAFALADEKGPGYLAQAQFYINEIDRRENQRIEAELRAADVKRDEIETQRWRIDLKLEKVIIYLIGLELIVAVALAIWGWSQQSKDVTQELEAFGKMQSVLSQMQESSKETADAIKAEREIMEAMRISLDRQVALFYDVQLNVVYNEGTKKLVLINTGRTNVALYEAITGDGHKNVRHFEKPQLIAPASSQEFELEESVNTLAKELPKGQERMFTFTFFVKNERQERFTLAGDLVAVWHGDVLTSNTHPNTIVPGWNK
jgi:hypothetical protein